MTVTASSVASIAARCLRTSGTIDPDTPLALLGLDSLSTIEMAAELEAAFGCELPADVLIDCTNVRSLTARISALRTTHANEARLDPFELMLADAVLPDDVRPETRPCASTDLRSARRILLTGATGFLGGALLEELLARTRAEILCLVRDSSASRRKPRDIEADHSAVRDYLETSASRDHELASVSHGRDVTSISHDHDVASAFRRKSRVRVLTGDFSHPRLGLSQARFDELGDTLDAVLHCGAAVNWVYTYGSLRAANVLGTLELLRLACRRGVPFHFVSSLSVCYPADGPQAADETYDALPNLRGVHLGYAQSKVVAEALVREAGTRGLPVRIYRPALISGHSTHGVFNRDDLITALVRGCVHMGTAPDLDWNLDCHPVDVVASGIVALSRESGPVFHLGHARPRHWRECVLWMRMYGYRLRLIPYHAWLRQLDAETAPASGEAAAHPLRPLRTFFLNRYAGARGLTLPELYEESRRTSASSEATHAAMAAEGVQSTPLDAALLDLYFTAFRECGQLPEPVLNRVEPWPVAASVDPGGTVAPGDALRMSALLKREVVDVTLSNSGSAHSIVSELTAWRSRRPTGLFAARVTLEDGGELNVHLKAKAADTDVIAAGEALAGLLDPAVGEAYAKWSDRMGFTASHVREIEIYRQTDPRFTRHAPRLLGSKVDEASGTWLLALEDLSGAALMNTADTPEAWRRRDIEAALAGLASLHAIWYGREAELRQQPWIGYVQNAAGMAEMSDLWTALAAHAAPAFSSWADPGIASLQRRLIAGILCWWPALEAAPRTLIHHDFNPRNVCLRNGSLRAYDWELATIGAPQRDLAEFLCFVLEPGCSGDEVQGWIDYYRLALESTTGTPIDPVGWHGGFRAALYDLLINRFATYALVHRIRRQSFLPRVVRTWWRLYEQFPIEEHA